MSKEFPSMEEMIKECENKQTSDEIIAFGLGLGRIVPSIMTSKKNKKGMEEALKLIVKQEGFLGIHTVDIWHTIAIYRTLNNAKRCRNLLSSKGCSVGEIVPLLVRKEFLKNGK